MIQKDEQYNFVERTQHNLQFITETTNKREPINDDFYDFTNLINHCLGLLSYVYEYVYDSIEYDHPNDPSQQIKRYTKVKLDQIFSKLAYNPKRYGNISISRSFDNNNDCTDISILLYHMRNAICHGHIKPIVENDSRIIKQAYLWDENKNHRNPHNTNNKNFEITMDVAQLRYFANDIADAYNEYIELTSKITLP